MRDSNKKIELEIMKGTVLKPRRDMVSEMKVKKEMVRCEMSGRGGIGSYVPCCAV